MSFFSQEELSVGKSFDSNAFEPIPEGTKVLAIISNAEWRDADAHNERHVSLTWDVVDGEYKGRKINHRIKLHDKNPGKLSRAKKMMIAIDANCKGLIAETREEPTVQGLQSLLHTPMYIQLGVYDLDGKKGNYVVAVNERRCGSQPQVQQQTTPAAQSQEPPMDFDDDIPF